MEEGKETIRSFIFGLIDKIKMSDNMNWNDMDLSDYHRFINSLLDEEGRVCEKLQEAVNSRIIDKKASSRSLSYNLSTNNEISSYYREQMVETLRNIEAELFLLYDEASLKLIINLIRIFLDFIVFDYYENMNKQYNFEIFEGRPKLKVSFGQHACTPVTTFKKAELIVRDFSRADTKVLFMGDYDLGCLALKSLADFEVHVLDLDRELLRFIESKNKNITTHSVNLKRGLPDDMKGYFDAVVLDPFWHIEGFDLFLNPACDAVKKKSGSRIYMTICPYIMGNNYLNFQKMILEKELVFHEIIRHFSIYIMKDNKSYRRVLSVFDEINKQSLNSILLDFVLRIPAFFSNMHVIGFI